ncbi:MAG: selenocysteine-specific translation elongation factor, partial [Nitriliruptorales bacterium]|nr:selenocysteine-specific translation elongation factor [Nitriliruptorales bacterium]
TAGHVDHGKSTLVKALTGMEPDRLVEEQRRGLTIDLGFAWADLPRSGPTGRPDRDQETVAFVDLPGHERFVGTMLAGAGAVDLALFVVAADEGWMPQSTEHLDILDLLGVSRGLVALTKADTVDDETIEVAIELVREQLDRTAMAAVDIIPVSAVTGDGLNRLVEALLDVLRTAPPPEDRGRPRLWVDRAFSVKGAGTVVTGTLGGGPLRLGDELTVMPGRRGGRIRGLQALKAAVTEVAAGSRVAVNLSGIDRGEVRRGDALGRAGQWHGVETLEAAVRALPGQPIGRRGAWHLHAGSGERLVRVYPLRGAAVTGEGFVRVELDRALALTAGDRFVLREAGREATAGGGLVLDSDPPRRVRGSAQRRERVEQLAARRAALDAGDRHALLGLHVRERGAAPLAHAAAAIGLSLDAAARIAKNLGLVDLGPAVADPAAAERWAGGVLAALAAHHATHPLDRAAPRDVAVRAAEAAGCPAPLSAPLLDRLIAEDRIVPEHGTVSGVRTPEHAVRLDPQQAAARQALLAAVGREPFAPPALSAATERAGAPPALVRELEASGALVRLGPDLAVTAGTLDLAVERLREAVAAEGPLTAARAKEVLGTTRKFALPLLEELDRRGRTRRRGDLREIVG